MLLTIFGVWIHVAGKGEGIRLMIGVQQEVEISAEDFRSLLKQSDCFSYIDRSYRQPNTVLYALSWFNEKAIHSSVCS